NISNGISVDQLAAVRIGGQTQLPSLELGVEPGGNAGSCDSGYSCAYSSNISWRSPTMPMAKEINPKLVYERMFRSAGIDRSERTGRGAMLKGVLDLVREDAIRLKQELGVRDRRKIDEYFTAVREVEQRIEKAERSSAQRPPNCLAPTMPAEF